MKLTYKSHLLFLILLLGLQACMPGTSTASPATDIPDIGEPPVLLDLYVAASGDDANDCMSESSACSTVWGALRKMTSPAVINIGPGTFYTGNISYSLIYDATLRGAGMDATILAADRASAVIQISRPITVSIEALTIGPAREGGADNWGLEVRGAGARVTLRNCRIADLIHGVTVWEDAFLNIENCRIERNKSGVENGGSLTVGNSLFTSNTTALTSWGTASVSSTDFNRNGSFDAASGAGTAAISNRGQLTLNNVDIVDNDVHGLLIDDGTVNYTGGHISSNNGIGIWHIRGDFTGRSLLVADNGSYGINVGGRSDTTSIGVFRLTQSAILRNYSAGVRIDGGEVHLQNDTIGGNLGTSSGGGGIWIYGGNVFLLDSTVIRNTGHGVHGSGGAGTFTARRSVIALNSDTECDVDSRISASYGSPTLYACNDSITPDVIKLGSLAEIGGTFVYPIQEGSPLINAAGPASSCPSVDQRGVSRPLGATCDIGAYEYALAITAATPESTAELATIYTSTPEPVTSTFIVNAFCRKGPGTRYFDIDSFQAGEQVQVDGRDETDPRWWWVLVPSSSDHCWVSGVVFEAEAAMELLPVQPAPILPDAPAYLDDAPTCKPNDQARDVKLNWPGAANATGYRIYRDSTLIASVGANIGIYVDTVSFGATVSYGVEAINKDGASDRVLAISGGC